MGLRDAHAWTAEQESWLGTMPDAEVATRIGRSEMVVSRRRRALGVPTFRSTRGPMMIPCANCGMPTEKKSRDQRRSRRLFCLTECAAAGQKRRDTDMLRYGPGWKNRRAEIRKRDRGCRSCGARPKRLTELHVHHLVPFRFGGTNRSENLVALCETCHHKIEAITTQVLESIQVEVSLDGPSLTITVEGEQRWPLSAPGADSPTRPG